MEQTPFVERRSCPIACPHFEKIEGVWEVVLIGNGDLPILERVRKLEDEMSTVLPILESLKSAADRQEGRDQERLDAEKRRDKAWETFRRNLTLAVILVGLLVAAATYWKQVHTTLLKIPAITTSKDTGQVHSAHREAPPQDAATPTTP